MIKQRLVPCVSMGLAALCAGCASAPPAATQASEPQPAVTEAPAATPAPLVTTPPKVRIDRSALKDVGTSGPLDYSDARLWMCRPGNDPDECDRDLNATEFLADGSRKVVEHQKAAAPEFDCFYVYPTVKLTSAGPMTDFANSDIVLDPLLAQAARFNGMCRVYAPLYRQNGIVPGSERTRPAAGGNEFALGLGDVRSAFKYYLEHLSEGRKFVLIGHSQGTGMLMGMMAQDVDPVPAVRDRMISALLIGGRFMVPEGKVQGGSLQNIPICEKPGQVGCVIAYASYSKEVPPTPTALFGRSAEGQRAACTEPAALAGKPGPYKGSYLRLARVNPTFAADGSDKLPTDITTPYVLYRDVFTGACQHKDGFDYLEIALAMPKGDPRVPPPYRSAAIEGRGFGLHLMDYNLVLEDLMQAVSLQARAALH